MNEDATNRPMPETCPQCGGRLPGGALAGLCPACLLRQGAATDTATQPEAKAFVPPSVEEVSRLFPQFEILALLGKGGMGAVYKARQPALDRLVALKILPIQAAPDYGFTERFTREARALARLSHPNIVAVYEFGQVVQNGAGAPQGSAAAAWSGGAGGTPALPYFVMEYVDGVNLRQLQKAGRLSPREALQIVPQICDALQYAHDEGVVHRDIKPENILVDRKGRVKIADFGLVKIVGGRERSLLPAADSESVSSAQGAGRPTHLTEAGQVMGTPHYMAPEQVEHPQAVDHRADIYSVGVVFYEMLTGELPLGRFQPPSHRVQVDVRLDEVVLHALEKEPERRYQQASQVKTDVQRITANSNVLVEESEPARLPAAPLLTGDELVPQAKAVKTRLQVASAALLIAGCIYLGEFVLLSLLWGLMPVGSARALREFLQSLISGFPNSLVRLGWQMGLGLGNLTPLAGVLALVCAWQIRRLRGYSLAITASVLSILLAFWTLPLGPVIAPLGLIALLILCQGKVRAAFMAQKELETNRAPSAAEPRTGYRLAVTSAVLTLLSVAVAPIYGMMVPGLSGAGGSAAVVMALVYWLHSSAGQASVMLGWLALFTMRRCGTGARGLGYAVLGICYAPILLVFRFVHPAKGALWVQSDLATDQIPTNMVFALLIAGLLGWAVSAWRSRLARRGERASAFMQRLCWNLGIVLLGFTGSLTLRLPAAQLASWPGNEVSSRFHLNHSHVQPRPESKPESFAAHTPFGTLEVQAVADPEQEEWTCWLPDGTPWCPQHRRAFPPGASQRKPGSLARMSLLSPKREDRGNREVMIYFAGDGDLITNLARLRFECYVTNRGIEQLCADYQLENHQRRNNYRGAVTRVPADATAARIRLGVLAGTREDTDAAWAWTGDARKLRSKSIRHANEDWEVGIQGVDPAAAGLSVSFSYPLRWNGTPRIVAVDAAGKVHEPAWPAGEGYPVVAGMREMMGARVGSQLMFPGLDAAQLKELRLQIEPYLWTEFRDVSLQPERQTQVEVVDAGSK